MRLGTLYDFSNNGGLEVDACGTSTCLNHGKAEEHKYEQKHLRSQMEGIIAAGADGRDFLNS